MAECACGCGTEIAPHATYVRGHHWRVRREQAGIPEEKVCEGCGRVYTRTEIRQNTKHWLDRRFCSTECRGRAAADLLAQGLRRCGTCGEVKPLVEFAGGNWGCKVCAAKRRPRKATPEQNRERNLRNFYGITVEKYDAMLSAQGGVCAICEQPETAINYRTGEPYPLAVDHCRDTKKIRGLLCGNCNKGIGGLRHDPRLLEKALIYLRDTA